MRCEAANLAVRLIQSRSQKVGQALLMPLLRSTLVVRDSTAGGELSLRSEYVLFMVHASVIGSERQTARIRPRLARFFMLDIDILMQVA
jgi:hypothetical protein